MGLLSWLRRILRGQQVSEFSLLSDFNPRPACLKVIEDKPSVPDIYACRHKSKDAYKCLKGCGYDVTVVSGPAEGWEKEYHVWIELKHEGELYWYDPTWYNSNPIKYGCHKASLWTDREVVRHEYSGVLKPID